MMRSVVGDQCAYRMGVLGNAAEAAGWPGRRRSGCGCAVAHQPRCPEAAPACRGTAGAPDGGGADPICCATAPVTRAERACCRSRAPACRAPALHSRRVVSSSRVVWSTRNGALRMPRRRQRERIAPNGKRANSAHISPRAPVPTRRDALEAKVGRRRSASRSGRRCRSRSASGRGRRRRGAAHRPRTPA